MDIFEFGYLPSRRRANPVTGRADGRLAHRRGGKEGPTIVERIATIDRVSHDNSTQQAPGSAYSNWQAYAEKDSYRQAHVTTDRLGVVHSCTYADCMCVTREIRYRLK